MSANQAAPLTPAADGGNSNNGAGNQGENGTNQGRGNNNQHQNNNQNVQDNRKRNNNSGSRHNGGGTGGGTLAHPHHFKGACKDFDQVLGMPNERIDAKVGYNVFKDNISTYISSTFKNGADVESIVSEGVHPRKAIEDRYLPKDEDEDELKKSTVKRLLHENKIKLYVQRDFDMEATINQIYSLIWGQCSDGLKASIRHLKEYDEKKRVSDVLWLMKHIKELTAGIDHKTNKFFRYQQAMMKFWTIKQGPYECTDAYFTRFNSTLQTLEFSGGASCLYSKELDDNFSTYTDSKAEVVERVKAMCLLQRSDQARYSELLTELKNASFVENDEYPVTSADAYDLLLRRCNNVPTQPRSGGGSGSNGCRGSGLMFAQTEGGRNEDIRVPGRDGTTLTDDRRCFRCNKLGHICPNCPQQGTQAGLLQVRYNFVQSGGEEIIPKSWILLDTCSTASVGNNTSLVYDISDCPPDNWLTLVTNGGSQVFKQMACLNLFPLNLHFNSSSLATILLVKDVASIPGVYITMDTREENALVVHYGSQMYKFNQCEDGL